jgi:hypothetical protein
MSKRTKQPAAGVPASRWPKEVKIDYWPVPKRRDQVLAEGEVTGHAHRVEGEDVAVYGDEDERVLMATPGATIVHESISPSPCFPIWARGTRSCEYRSTTRLRTRSAAFETRCQGLRPPAASGRPAGDVAAARSRNPTAAGAFGRPMSLK